MKIDNRIWALLLAVGILLAGVIVAWHNNSNSAQNPTNVAGKTNIDMNEALAQKQINGITIGPCKSWITKSTCTIDKNTVAVTAIAPISITNATISKHGETVQITLKSGKHGAGGLCKREIVISREKIDSASKIVIKIGISTTSSFKLSENSCSQE